MECTFIHHGCTFSNAAHGERRKRNGGCYELQFYPQRSCDQISITACRPVSTGIEHYRGEPSHNSISAIASRDDPCRNYKAYSCAITQIISAPYAEIIRYIHRMVKGRYPRPLSSLLSFRRMTIRPLTGNALSESVKPLPSLVGHATPMSVHRVLSPSPLTLNRRLNRPGIAGGPNS